MNSMVRISYRPDITIHVALDCACEAKTLTEK